MDSCGRYEHVRSRACIAHFTASFELQDQERIVSVLESRVRRQFGARDEGTDGGGQWRVKQPHSCKQRRTLLCSVEIR